MPGKYTREAKFTGFDGVTKIRLYANEGKNGYNLGTTMKEPNKRATTGMQVTFQTEAEANAEFDRRVADAKAKGYATRGGGTGMIGRRSRFNELPTEPEWKGAAATSAGIAGIAGTAVPPAAAATDQAPEQENSTPSNSTETQTEPASPIPAADSVEEVEQLVTQTGEGRGSKGARRNSR